MEHKIKELRERAGYKSATQFAKENNISVPTYCRWEQGHMPPLDVAYKLAQRFGVSIDELINGEKTTVVYNSTMNELLAFSAYWDKMTPVDKKYMFTIAKALTEDRSNNEE